MEMKTMGEQSFRDWIHENSIDILRNSLDGVEREILDLNLPRYNYHQLLVMIHTRRYYGDILDNIDPSEFTAKQMHREMLNIISTKINDGADLFSFQKTFREYMDDAVFLEHTINSEKYKEK